MIVEEKYIYAYALKNAVEHNGKSIVKGVIPGLFNHGLTKEDVKKVINEVNVILNEINLMTIDEQKALFEKYKDLIGHRPEREGLPELPKVGKNGVVMRFAPAASGQLHIGHIIASMPSSIYVKKYGGKFYVRIEDTDPERIDKNAYKQFKIDCDWLFGNVSQYIIQSDKIKIYYKYAGKLIEKDCAYVCNCKIEKFRELILKNKQCPCRELSVKENLERWKKMLDKKGYKEGQAVLRFKSDVNNPNPALRDFPLARINLKKHPRQGRKYRVWPLMNLSVSVDDIEFKMTHIIRAKEHRDNAERQKMIYNALGFGDKFPVTLFIGRIKFTDIALSKRKIKAAIEEGEFEGWEDVRLPTIASLRKRGYQPEAFVKLAEQRGLSEVDKVISQADFFKVLDDFNREILRNRTRKIEFEEVEKKNSNVILVMNDASERFLKIKQKPKKDEVVYFNGLGYARFNGLKNKKYLFWFCHG